MHDSNKFTFKEVVLNVFKNRTLTYIFILALVLPVIFPIYGQSVVIPKYNNYIVKLSEQQAIKVTNFIGKHFFDGEHDVALTVKEKEELYQSARDLGAVKLRIFDDKGKIINSTKTSEIGIVNNKTYFHEKVAKGEIFTKLVRKGEKSVEGQKFLKDVAEIYVPCTSEGVFLGATEVYFDVTDQLAGIRELIKKSMKVSFSMSFTLMVLTLLVSYKASRAMLARDRAQGKLQNMNGMLEEIVKLQTKEIRATQETSIEALSILAEYYDVDTGAHLERMQGYVNLLSQELGEDSKYSDYIHSRSDYFEELALASLLHDIGKTAIPKSILMKPGKLDFDEFERMKTHTSIAGEILERGNDTFVDKFGKNSYLSIARDVALYHHEKWDGTGYPKKLSGEEIPLSARITAIADVYDALRSKRPYKDSWSHEKTVEVIKQDSGSHFDPEIVRIFLKFHEKFDEIFKKSS
jgi:HD-GYP domain-containing protein (c-di-GMP phosphodiesterase class II)